ncbi:MAG: cbb3-type cytochrome oxidase assembly protein CcoS [Bacteroidales bacterium]|nr:cbb3-type cytochrome oxidase assembly protein CcoS [Bacteroidales bacterium]
MSVIFFLIAIGIIVAGGFLAAFIWSVKSGQYDDDYTPSVRMLFDNYAPEDDHVQEAEERKPENASSPKKNSKTSNRNNNKS